MASSPASANMVLESLRRQTKELHRQTERALDLVRSASSRDAYASLLERLLGFYEPLEARLFNPPVAAFQAQLDFEARRKVPALRADLAILRPSMVTAECCTHVPALHSPMTRLGAWYVVEGATRGGAVIAAHLARELGLGRDTGAGFFDCYGEQRERNWEQFCTLLNTTPASEAGEVTAGAIAVFAAMRRWLAERSPSRGEAVS